MVTFKVDDVNRGSFDSKYISKRDRQRLKLLVGPGVESSSSAENDFMMTTHNLLGAINTAYDQHLPLVLSPDMIWLFISQGLSNHITNNAEELRKQFVNFEGKKELIVREDSFVKGSPDNDWPHTFGEFSKQIAEHIGKKRDLIVNSFSTTGPVELAASEVVLMESMSKYFDYSVHTLCGIPEITLLGTVKDWQDVQTRVHAMSEFGLEWWTAKLNPIMDEFVKAAQGKANAEFWQHIYKESGGSGGPYISGWITDFFPYLTDRNGNATRRNEFTAKAGAFGGYTSSAFPIGVAKVPFKWKYYSQEFKMELIAGFSGFKYEEETIKPQIGWFVRDTELMKAVSVTFTDPRDYNKRDAMRQDFINQLSKLGFEENPGGWGDTITGHVPGPNFEKVKEIKGLIFSK